MRPFLRGLSALVMTALFVTMPSTTADAQAVPSDVSARCGDGSYSRARTAQAACAQHGGVAIWYGGTAKTRSEGSAQRPSRAPRGATAECNDGTFSFVKPRRFVLKRRTAACDEHDGVRAWFK
jgi:hypothetical protein